MRLFGLDRTLLWLLVHRLGIAPVSGKLATAGAVFLFNFGLRKALLFTTQPQRKALIPQQ